MLHELHTAMKTNHTYQSEFRQAESKLAVVEKQRSKLKEQIPAEKLAKSRKFRLIEKELDKSLVTKFRARAARANYLAADRTDIQYAVKECCRGMASPEVRHLG